MLITVLLLLSGQLPAQDLQETADRLERASLLIEALRDQLPAMKPGAEVGDVDRAVILRDELPVIPRDGQRRRISREDPGFRALYTAPATDRVWSFSRRHRA